MEEIKGKQKIKKVVNIIYWIVIISINVYIYLIYRGPLFAKKIEPLANESDYAVYSGRNVYEHWKGTLDQKLQVLYDEMKESCLQFNEEFITKVEELNMDEIEKVYDAIELDHPEIFWLETYEARKKWFTDAEVNTNKTIKLYFNTTKEEAIEIKKRIEPNYQRIIDVAKELEDDYEKIKYVHDELINIGKYIKNDELYNHSMVSIFDTGETVCVGYSEGFKFIMDNLGIKAISSWDITQEDENKNHEWNMVYLEGDWYNVDVTWDETQKEGGGDPYYYFLIYDEYFYTDHKMQEGIPE